MKMDEIKSSFLKLKRRENQIKAKKKSDGAITNFKINNKSNKIKEPSFKRISLNTNTNFSTQMNFIPKTSANKNEFNSLIESKKLCLVSGNKNKLNDIKKINYNKYNTNKISGNFLNLKESKKLNILIEKLKDSSPNNILNKYKRIRNTIDTHKLIKNKINSNEKINNTHTHFFAEKIKNNYEKNKKVVESPNSTFNDIKARQKNKIKQDKINLKFTEKTTYNLISSPINIMEIANIQKRILPAKKNSSNNNTKYGKYYNKRGNNISNSCYNFYQKNGNDYIEDDYNDSNKLNIINNYKINKQRNIFKIDENMSEKNKNKNCILFEKINTNLNKEKLNNFTNQKNSLQNNENTKYKRNNIYNKKDKEKNKNNKKGILNKIFNLENNKFLEYQKKLIEYFCKSIEDFIFMSVKKKFNDFIKNIKEFSISKNTHYLLMKRLQNKGIQKNYFNNNEKTCFNKYSTQNENNSNYSSIIMMNNSNIINLPRKEYDFSKNFYREYIEKKDIYDFNKTQLQSPILIENIDRKNTYYKEMSYNNGLHSDIYNLNDKENSNSINMNNYINDKKRHYNYPNLYYLKRNNIINRILNNDINNKDKKSETNFENINNNIYIPKKIKLTYNSRTISAPLNEYIENNSNNSYILNPYENIGTSHHLFSKVMNKRKSNQNHKLIFEPSYLSKKYSSTDDLQNVNNISHNIHHSSYNSDILNYTNDKIKYRNNRIISENTDEIFSNQKNSIYKKKLKKNSNLKAYTKPKQIHIRNQIIDINLNLNNNNKNVNQYLSPNINNNIKNIDFKPNTDFSKKQQYIPSILSNPNYLRIAYTEPRREMNLNSHHQNKFGNIQELTINLSKNSNSNIKGINGYNNNNNIYIYSQNDFDNCQVKEFDNSNNDVNNEINKEKNVLNEMDEADNNSNQIKETIIKDASSSDGKLNVFIKYIEMPNMDETIKKEPFNNNIILLNYFQIDSFFIPAEYQKIIPSNIYYKNFCSGNRFNNRTKFQKILSSIKEEEEKSKAAGSVGSFDNSSISDEGNKKNNKYSNYFTQSIKYFSNLLESIFDDKKKDSFYKFFKILKKIKNESLLKGIIIEKKYEILNKTKNEEKENEDNNYIFVSNKDEDNK